MAIALAMTAAPAFGLDLDTGAVLGSGVGGALGAFIGSELGGQTGAVIGGGVGAAAGAAITTSRYPRYRQGGNRYASGRCPPGHWKHGRCRGYDYYD